MDRGGAGATHGGLKVRVRVRPNSRTLFWSCSLAPFFMLQIKTEIYI